jgi:hypothetical protein
MADLWRDFWTRETRMGQQVAQLHDRYMMIMMNFQVIHHTALQLESDQSFMCQTQPL